jgi:hypothetical protein
LNKDGPGTLRGSQPVPETNMNMYDLAAHLATRATTNLYEQIRGLIASNNGKSAAVMLFQAGGGPAGPNQQRAPGIWIVGLLIPPLGRIVTKVRGLGAYNFTALRLNAFGIPIDIAAGNSSAAGSSRGRGCRLRPLHRRWCDTTMSRSRSSTRTLDTSRSRCTRLSMSDPTPR